MTEVGSSPRPRIVRCPECDTHRWIIVEEAMCEARSGLAYRAGEPYWAAHSEDGGGWQGLPGAENSYYSYVECEHGHKLEGMADRMDEKDFDFLEEVTWG
jgi:hypothetical protein